MIDVIRAYIKRKEEILERKKNIELERKTPNVQNDPIKKNELDKERIDLFNEETEIIRYFRKIGLQRLFNNQNEHK